MYSIKLHRAAQKCVLPLIWMSIRFLYGKALLLDICSEMLTLRRLTLLKFSLLARPARAASEYSDVLLTTRKIVHIFYQNVELQGGEQKQHRCFMRGTHPKVTLFTIAKSAKKT